MQQLFLKICLIVNLSLVCFSLSARCTTVNGGSYDGSVSINYAGISAEYAYQYESSIYTNADVGSFGIINSVGLFTVTAVNTNIPVKIYMKQNAASVQALNTWSNTISSATLVFDGIVNLSSSGWNYIALDLPFDYNSGNLELMFESSFGGFGLGAGNAPYNAYFVPSGAGKPPIMSQSWIGLFSPVPSSQGITTQRPLLKFGFNEDITWLGSSDAWDNGTNWSSGFSPCFCDNVTIPVTSNDPVIGANISAECNSIAINANVVLEIGNQSAFSASFNVYGDFLNNGSILHSSDSYTFLNSAIGSIGGSGDYAFAGEVSRLEISQKGNYTLSDNVNTLHYLKVSGQLSLGNYTCQVYDLDFGATSTISLNTGVLEVANNIDYSFGGDLIFNTGTVYFNSGDPAWVALGLAASDQTINGFFYYDLKIRANNGTEVTVGDGTSVAISNDLIIENPSIAGGVVSSVEEIRVNGKVYLASSGNALTLNLGDRLYNNAGISSFTMGTQAANAINITYSSATEDAIENLGALNFFGTVTYASAASQRILSANYINLSIVGDGPRYLYDPVSISGDLDLSAGSLNAQGYAINLAGDWSNNGGQFIAGGSAVYFDGSSQQSISRSGAVSILVDSFSSLSNWTEVDLVGAVDWAVGNGSPSGGFSANSGSSCAYFFENANNGSQAYIYYDLPAFTNRSISYSYINPDWFGDVDYFYCDYFDGSSWIDLNPQTTAHSSWTSATHAIPDGATKIRFYGWLQWGHGVGLDDVSITGEDPSGVIAEDFDNLTCDNSGGLLLNSPVNINSSLTFSSGHITSSSTNYLKFDEDATVSGVSDASHVVGPVRKLTNTTQQFVFPVGDGSEYRASAITPSSSAATGWSSEYFPSTPPNSASVTGPAAGLDHIFTNFYWDISRFSGTADGYVGLYWNSGSGVDVPADLVVSHYNSAGSEWEKVGVSPTISGSASSGNIIADQASTSFSPFTLGSGTSNNSLPIALVSFSGECLNEGVEIDFSVASQVNNEYFIIERSVDAFLWGEVGRIAGVEGGFSNTQINYKFVDQERLQGLSYYRLKQQDFNGAVKEFSPISVSCNSIISDVALYPNPTSGVVNLEFESLDFVDQNTLLELVDARGVLVKQHALRINKGFNRLTIDCGGLAKGMYFIHVKARQSIIPPQRVMVR
ncbi:MAG: T9SS type A sorting domain-containing protein [Parvicellaceae bacterium]